MGNGSADGCPWAWDAALSQPHAGPGPAHPRLPRAARPLAALCLPPATSPSAGSRAPLPQAACPPPTGQQPRRLPGVRSYSGCWGATLLSLCRKRQGCGGQAAVGACAYTRVRVHCVHVYMRVTVVSVYMRVLVCNSVSIQAHMCVCVCTAWMCPHIHTCTTGYVYKCAWMRAHSPWTRGSLGPDFSPTVRAALGRKAGAAERRHTSHPRPGPAHFAAAHAPTHRCTRLSA